MAKFQGGIETSCGNVDDDEISNVEKRQLLKCKQICICGKIPMRERDELQESNSFVDGDRIPMRERDKYGNAMKLHL